jgi:transposase
MEQPAIFSATLGLSHPWKVTAVAFVREENRLDITIDFDLGNRIRCAHCGHDVIPARGEDEIWHHDDFLCYSTYLHARIPHIECPCGNIFPVERPWSRAGSKFTPLQ